MHVVARTRVGGLLAVRCAALRRLREHAVTIGCAAGLLLQLPVIHTAHNFRLNKTADAGPLLGWPPAATGRRARSASRRGGRATSQSRVPGYAVSAGQLRRMGCRMPTMRY